MKNGLSQEEEGLQGRESSFPAVRRPTDKSLGIFAWPRQICGLHTERRSIRGLKCSTTLLG